MLRPWKQGKLATMDGRARFAEVSFVGKSCIRITPLINFPQQPIDKQLIVEPETNLFITQSGGLFHVADIDEKKTKSLAPYTSWAFWASTPLILDPKNGIVSFGYIATSSYKEQPFYNVIYDTKNDQMLYESPPKGESHNLFYSVTPEWAMCYKRNDGNKGEIVLYNWKTFETAENELTRKLSDHSIISIFEPGCNINPEGRYLFAKFDIPGEITGKTVKITWDEDYEDVTVIPLDYLIPEGKWFDDIFISADGQWGTTLIGGYRGLYGEFLYKRVFFHLDARYPNGISMPVYGMDYEEYRSYLGTYVEHPEYGWCYAEEKWLDGGRKQYLRLYKMDDVLAEINRQL
jgi:hypothetical protein